MPKRGQGGLDAHGEAGDSDGDGNGDGVGDGDGEGDGEEGGAGKPPWDVDGVGAGKVDG